MFRPRFRLHSSVCLEFDMEVCSVMRSEDGRRYGRVDFTISILNEKAGGITCGPTELKHAINPTFPYGAFRLRNVGIAFVGVGVVRLRKARG